MLAARLGTAPAFRRPRADKVALYLRQLRRTVRRAFSNRVAQGVCDLAHTRLPLPGIMVSDSLVSMKGVGEGEHFMAAWKPFQACPQECLAIPLTDRKRICSDACFHD